jgi:hypothetical protein
MNSSLLSLERPSFGQFARKVANVRTQDIEECLLEQQAAGGRLGELLRARGLIRREHVTEILGLQAIWMARTLEPDLRPFAFPYPAFFSLCMPAYNEEANIEDTLDSAIAILPHFVDSFEIVVTDDGSRDNTREILRRYGARDSRVRLLEHPQNRGYGAAVTTALRAARGDLISFTDSDGQFSFLDLAPVLTKLKGHDAVLGYRHKRADSLLRLFNAWGWNWVIRVVLGVWVKDLDCAFKVFRKEAFDQIVLTSAGATINAEMLAQSFRLGHKICETPVTHWPRSAGAPTGAALKVILKAFRDLPRMWKYRWVTPLAPARNENLSSPSIPQPSMHGDYRQDNSVLPMPEPLVCAAEPDSASTPAPSRRTHRIDTAPVTTVEHLASAATAFAP